MTDTEQLYPRQVGIMHGDLRHTDFPRLVWVNSAEEEAAVLWEYGQGQGKLPPAGEERKP